MSVLTGMEPKSVFTFFEEICQIPHGSGNVDQISDYLQEFARKRKLFCIQDELKNIIIIKEASAGYEEEKPYILQAHMDMVAVKDCGLRLRMAGFMRKGQALAVMMELVWPIVWPFWMRRISRCLVWK